ncbi:hypothetical protein ACWD6N_33630 [Micromonospora sp. NPDC005163]
MRPLDWFGEGAGDGLGLAGVLRGVGGVAGGGRCWGDGGEDLCPLEWLGEAGSENFINQLLGACQVAGGRGRLGNGGEDPRPGERLNEATGKGLGLAGQSPGRSR